MNSTVEARRIYPEELSPALDALSTVITGSLDRSRAEIEADGASPSAALIAFEAAIDTVVDDLRAVQSHVTESSMTNPPA